MKPLQFSVNRQDAPKTGDRFWMIGLPDGREVVLWANLVEIAPNGTLAVHGGSRDGAQELKLALPPGAWAHVYAASVIDGSPVCVERLEAPE